MHTNSHFSSCFRVVTIVYSFQAHLTGSTAPQARGFGLVQVAFASNNHCFD